ncbi:uncharacterized protein JCM15063_003621 [Sporobolomyces koalae]|uniref:uncharacterized protein n=1 Tax=Sporobolomyces koalae TaxID=500713 RepID=UPI00317B9244
MVPPASSKQSSRAPSVHESAPLLGANDPKSRTSSLLERQFQSDSDRDSALSIPFVAKSQSGDADRPTHNKPKTKHYGTMSPSSREEQAFATLPARLSRAASADRKRSMQAQRPSTKLGKFRQRAQYYVPIFNWLPNYTKEKLGKDTIAALTITSLIVPQAMSYATNLVHSNPVNGLFGAAIPAFVYSIFGTCRQLSMGPEAALSLLMGEVIAKMIESEEHAHYGGVGGMGTEDKARFTAIITSFIVFEAGAISFLLGFLRLGFLDAVLSRALMRGFITAVGVVIFIGQFVSILGLEGLLAKQHGSSSSVPEKVVFIFTHLKHTHMLTLAVSAVAVAILVGTKIVKRKLLGGKRANWVKYVPEVLVVVIGATILSHALDWHQHGLETLGKVSPSALKFSWPLSFANGGPKGKTHYLSYAHSCIGTAAVIAVLGFLDSIVAAKGMASTYDYPISPNRELTALGLSNLSASLVSGTLPGFGSITRTRLAASTGAKTQFASFLTGAFTLAVTFGLLGLLRDLPKCILAVVVGVVVFSILEEAPEDIKFFWKMRAWTDLLMLSITFLLSLFVSVEVGIITSVCLSMILCIKQSTLTHIKILGRVPGTNSFSALSEGNNPGDNAESSEHDYSNSLDLFNPSASNIHQGGSSGGAGGQEELPGILIIRLRDLSLHFANTSALKERLRRLEKYGPERSHPADEPRRSEASVVVFEMKDVVGVDPGAARVLEEVVKSYTDRDVLIYWVQPQQAVLEVLRKADIIEISGGEDHLQPSVSVALEAIEKRMKDVTRRHGVVSDQSEDNV